MTRMTSLDLALIGNSSYSALIDRNGRYVWSCIPRVDGDPVFCALVNGETDDDGFGFYDIELEGFSRSEQQYVENTAIVVTRLYADNGSALEIVDFAPRYKQLGRVYRPIMAVRSIRPLKGSPRIRVRLRPASGYGTARATTTFGSNHIRYVMPALTLRLNTDVPVSYVLEEVPFLLDGPYTLILGPDETFNSAISEGGRDFLEKTGDYWRDWTRSLSIPFEWQDEVIRAAITLKLCAYEETGAIVAAMTTSIPEAPGSERNWDYRYCWLRDSYFVVHALNRLGATRTMEEYLRFISNIAAIAENGHLQPVYGVAMERHLTELKVEALGGYRGMGPVRIGNQACEHIQNDVYGAVIMSIAQVIFDRRLGYHRDHAAIFERLEAIGDQAYAVYDKPDAGLWEFRTIAKVHTFSAVMCWVACDRLARIAHYTGRPEREAHWRSRADEIERTVHEKAWNARRNCFIESFGDGDQVDASLLLLNDLGFLAADDPKFAGTVAAIEQDLRIGDYLYRYVAPDDFGVPETSFTICSFWYVNALAALGRKEEARRLFENLLACRNHVGLLSEDIATGNRELWGNFPQTYSMVGLITCAMRLSKSWEEAY
jgi:GH15 family glucan-1,4-alpha-glucosidase